MSQNPLRVVIAEDEALIRLDLKEMLEEEGYSSRRRGGRRRVWPSSTSPRLRPDLAILDIKMPVLDGMISAAERIAAERIAPVVILTALLPARAGGAGPATRALWLTW